MRIRLIEILVALACLAFATALVGPVVATVFTPGWVETADGRDWASMAFFLSIAGGLVWLALRLIIRRARSVRGLLRSSDWWVLAALALLATICAAAASHWMIASPGLIPIAAAVGMARRRARQERLVLVEAISPDDLPRPPFTGRPSSGPRPV